MDFTKEYLIPLLKGWNQDAKERGLIPTVELLIEELENK